MTMWQFDGQTLTGYDRDQQISWCGRLVVEDNLGIHEFTATHSTDGYRGTADAWQVWIDGESCSDLLGKITVYIMPLSDRVLKRLYLLVTEDALGNPVARPGNKILAMPTRFVDPNGVVTLEEGQKASSSVMTMIVNRDIECSNPVQNTCLFHAHPTRDRSGGG